ncbi:hypothetical protein OVA07_11030 [Novosphingobium sp. SL115]|uniref:hypothetical protein n=1 Tax=Novosphingobium sp. SL115 TaxID=2995150 RepID=UPI002272A3A1|nr:hypothetical protein [Novosphingobium sp. SL115]MCY1671542.1 hypothetical protein [Novosphingobium sp. SL115]
MSDPHSIAEARALRDEALAVFRADLDLVKAETSPARFKERAVGEAVEMIESARDIASENKAVIGVTLATLLAWFFRGPLQDLARRLADTVRSGD